MTRQEAKDVAQAIEIISKISRDYDPFVILSFLEWNIFNDDDCKMIIEVLRSLGYEDD